MHQPVKGIWGNTLPALQSKHLGSCDGSFNAAGHFQRLQRIRRIGQNSPLAARHRCESIYHKRASQLAEYKANLWAVMIMTGQLADRQRLVISVALWLYLLWPASWLFLFVACGFLCYYGQLAGLFATATTKLYHNNLPRLQRSTTWRFIQHFFWNGIQCPCKCFSCLTCLAEQVENTNKKLKEMQMHTGTLVGRQILES